ncbi:DNA polymerase III subunit gamma/tau [Anaplasma capra]|uniref:DNA polymerase III subunit gamma/tau n=1 Tax=Anaplasma capra TaxID=1562740 RepID=UPI0021D612A6|nr:DNA polymerase III subunit gamma/tau [Anaplasma capra]MCU7611176.1 DNA polymerase III subunit gamma/tau [Anaplasma capra]
MNLALKYRPRSFDDLVGQDVLVRILKNSFALGSLSSPILMVGASGVGKTTCARIVSLCLNCVNGPTPDPCGACHACVSIKNSTNPDVIEIDAASNTGVDDIRTILENSSYLPTSSRFKVYIIDEVHMLSISAFNALLKTLEDPVEHVRFIMATTEVRKVPVTVISRCQRLDLYKLSVEQLFAHLVEIAKKEGIEHDGEGLRLIAENSSGSVRNALFLLEQSFVYTKNRVFANDVRTLLGCVDKSLAEGLVKYILLADARSALEAFRKLCCQSQPISVLEGVQLIVYELCVASVSREYKFDLGSDLLSTTRSDSTPFLSRVWQALAHGLQEVKNSGDTQRAGEMVVVRLCYLSGLPSPQKIAGFLLSKTKSTAQVDTVKKKVEYATHNSKAPIPGRDANRLGASSMEDCSSSGGNYCLGEVADSNDRAEPTKKNGVNTSDKMYNPEEDEAVMGVVRDFEGASVVGFCDLD